MRRYTPLSSFGLLVLQLIAIQLKVAHSLLPCLPLRTRSARTFEPRLETVRLQASKRNSLLDQLAGTLFRLENDRVDASSVVDDKGRVGEPMEWSEGESWTNKLSEFVANNGYGAKQWIADVVAGDDYDQEAVCQEIDSFVQDHPVAMFSYARCPFSRRAKDALEERGIAYEFIDLDRLESDDEGNAIRAELGRKTRRTSVPSIFVKGQFIGGCNDGPGLLPLLESGEFDKLLNQE